MFSVTNTVTNLRPLWTAKVRPTNSGVTVLRRDQVRMILRSLVRTASSTFLPRWESTNGPFLVERAIGYFFPRCLMMNLVDVWFLRVLRPLLSWPQGETG